MKYGNVSLLMTRTSTLTDNNLEEDPSVPIGTARKRPEQLACQEKHALHVSFSEFLRVDPGGAIALCGGDDDGATPGFGRRVGQCVGELRPPDGEAEAPVSGTGRPEVRRNGVHAEAWYQKWSLFVFEYWCATHDIALTADL